MRCVRMQDTKEHILTYEDVRETPTTSLIDFIFSASTRSHCLPHRMHKKSNNCWNPGPATFSRMIQSKFVALVSTICIALSWCRILVSAFHLSPYRFYNVPLGSPPKHSLCLRSTVDKSSEGRDTPGTRSIHGYSVLLADNRESIYGIKLYRFGGPNIDDYMKSKPDLVSREDALRSLTPTCDDNGIQKVYYSEGVFGESVQFFAQVDDISEFISSTVRDDEEAKLSLLQAQGVLGSVEAVREYEKDGDDAKKVSIELKNLSVHPSARRRGIGKALTEAVQEYARRQASKLEQENSTKYTGAVHLTVEKCNEGAMRLYGETGFVVMDDHDDDDDELCTLSWSTAD